MGAGLYWLNELSPETSINMVTTYIIPLAEIMHGLETLGMSTSGYSVLVTFHQKLLMSIHLPRATAHTALYLLTGSLPLKAIHHTNVFTLFVTMTRRVDSVEKEVLQCQVTIKDMVSHSWTMLDITPVTPGLPLV